MISKIEVNRIKIEIVPEVSKNTLVTSSFQGGSQKAR